MSMVEPPLTSRRRARAKPIPSRAPTTNHRGARRGAARQHKQSRRRRKSHCVMVLCMFEFEHTPISLSLGSFSDECSAALCVQRKASSCVGYQDISPTHALITHRCDSSAAWCAARRPHTTLCIPSPRSLQYPREFAAYSHGAVPASPGTECTIQ